MIGVARRLLSLWPMSRCSAEFAARRPRTRLRCTTALLTVTVAASFAFAAPARAETDADALPAANSLGFEVYTGAATRGVRAGVTTTVRVGTWAGGIIAETGGNPILGTHTVRSVGALFGRSEISGIWRWDLFGEAGYRHHQDVVRWADEYRGASGSTGYVGLRVGPTLDLRQGRGLVLGVCTYLRTDVFTHSATYASDATGNKETTQIGFGEFGVTLRLGFAAGL